MIVDNTAAGDKANHKVVGDTVAGGMAVCYRVDYTVVGGTVATVG
ncbi:hypothetical protein HMI01_19110 [Halolactibacillus miurensis]|uniref:Uncharacterized protein n=1 Tax=Halolactibacillus miurensis TaxID=306541 RepID=A0ABQ0VUT0_9BACI|nr:hypothetical protein HMI01_19110 [Halolactibacillus miurensis]